MSLKVVIPALAVMLGAGGVAFAEPPEETAEQAPRASTPLPPVLADIANARRQSLERPHDHANKRWGRGDYLPEEYRDDYFNQWEAYHLSEAQEGYRWVRVNRGVYRVNLDDGHIAEAVFGLPAN